MTKGGYSLAMALADRLTGWAAACLPRTNRSKRAAFLRGRRGWYATLERELRLEPGRKTLWLHASSLGEFAIARPLIEELRSRHDCQFVITFFSPSGYEAVKPDAERYENVFYLPWDTKRNVRAFLDRIRPDAALFMVSEYWHNFLGELCRRGVPTFLVSALIRDDSVFFKWYGGDYRRDLQTFTQIFTLDDRSVENLARLGCTCAVRTGDPLFDNARAIARRPYANPIIERFKGGDRLFVAGSIGTDEDLTLIAALTAAYPGTKFLIVPHAVSEEEIGTVLGRLGSGAVRSSACTEETDFAGVQALVVDFVGALASLYRYGSWAYVGGGFTPFLHSVIEAVAYGLPVAFGPRVERKVTPQQLMELGIGTKVASSRELCAWFGALQHDEAGLDRIRQACERYFEQNTGSTGTVARKIGEYL